MSRGTSGETRAACERVLVVDDNRTNRQIVAEMLGGGRHDGLVVDEAVDGPTGLDLLTRMQAARTPYRLAIIDAQMPGRDGFELAGDIRTAPGLGETRLLMLTSMGSPGDGQRCRDLGIDAYLTKPISRTELLDAVAAVLGAPGRPAEHGTLITRHTIEEARRNLRILLAEDNAVNQEVAATMLRKRGHQVHIVENGREAVAAVTRDTYDVV